MEFQVLSTNPHATDAVLIPIYALAHEKSILEEAVLFGCMRVERVAFEEVTRNGELSTKHNSRSSTNLRKGLSSE